MPRVSSGLMKWWPRPPRRDWRHRNFSPYRTPSESRGTWQGRGWPGRGLRRGARKQQRPRRERGVFPLDRGWGDWEWRHCRPVRGLCPCIFSASREGWRSSWSQARVRGGEERSYNLDKGLPRSSWCSWCTGTPWIRWSELVSRPDTSWRGWPCRWCSSGRSASRAERSGEERKNTFLCWHVFYMVIFWQINNLNSYDELMTTFKNRNA